MTCHRINLEIVQRMLENVKQSNNNYVEFNDKINDYTPTQVI